MFLIDTAYANPLPGAAQQTAGGYSGIVGILLLLAIGYFFMLRPQMKRQKEQRKLIASLTTGDEIVTIGGVVGKIKNVEDHFFGLEIANNTVIKIQRSAVSTVLPKGSMQAAAS